MQENHRDRALQHLEAKRAEEQHRDEQHPADHLAVLEEPPQLRHHRLAFARHHVFQCLAQRCQEHVLVDHPRQRDNHEDEQRRDGEQRIVRDCAGEEQTLVCLEGFEDLKGEGDWVLEDVDGARVDDLHGWPWLTG